MDTDTKRDRLIDLSERCRITGEGRSTLYERMKRQEVTVVKLGRRTLFSEAEAYAFVQQQLEAARQSASA
jgi:predicted DNA-binding transcriptional regulator AlpA